MIVSDKKNLMFIQINLIHELNKFCNQFVVLQKKILPTYPPLDLLVIVGSGKQTIFEAWPYRSKSVTDEKMLNTICPGRGSNQDLLRGSQTLYRIAIKAGLYRKAVQVCIIPNITTYSPSILDSSPNLN